ncbi:S4 domain-containing protein YaaA [Alteribacillus iranensis]|uniref:S4 domain protein YaaA n=1 Tax=Alteribacillus iranensis TaxID=930128 RepID=A0A1I2C775_9BACI|nr:S4 domain-containing protein YaaA [Alteribacillus iranensis]SFE63683.1 S4 domain protein YaaA [Alteribacillus iranensis]
MSRSIEIETEYITLGQMLKEAALIDSGGMAKWFLSEYKVMVNGEPEDRRGKKLYDGDEIHITEMEDFIVKSNKK